MQRRNPAADGSQYREALGVRARVNLTDKTKLFQSTVNVRNLHAMENLLAEPAAFNGNTTSSRFPLTSELSGTAIAMKRWPPPWPYLKTL